MELGARLRRSGLRSLAFSSGQVVLEVEQACYVLTEAQAEQIRRSADVCDVLNEARVAPRQWIRVRRPQDDDAQSAETQHEETDDRGNERESDVRRSFRGG